jgi:DNA-binding HxlR family transcriptional regulator
MASFEGRCSKHNPVAFSPGKRNYSKCENTVGLVINMDIESCPVTTAIDVIAGKWKPLILYHLKNGNLSFGELLRRIPQGSCKVLTEQPRQLSAEGVVSRKYYSGRVLHTEYLLTEYGKSLRPILTALASWGGEHRKRKQIEKNQPEDIEVCATEIGKTAYR